MPMDPTGKALHSVPMFQIVEILKFDGITNKISEKKGAVNILTF